jgi:NADP-dependent 3-hydroxy acid dehydrogenase YdfG
MTPGGSRTALVTGASRGIGAAVALSLAAEGIRVALLARSLDQLAQKAQEAGSDSFAVQCDVTNDPSIDRAVSQLKAEFGGAPDIIVNNAGLFTIEAIEKTTQQEFDNMLATNLRAPFRFVREFLPEMRMRGSGHIVTIGSIADRHIFAGNAAYSATKYGQRAMHEVLREETRGTGIRATLISPAAVNTDVWDPIQYLGTDARPDRSAMLDVGAVSAAVMFAVTQPAQVNVDELRLSRA